MKNQHWRISSNLWDRSVPYFALILAAFAFSGMHVFSKPGLSYIPPQAFALFRITLAVLPLGLTAYCREGTPTYSKYLHIVHLIMGVLGIACNQFFAFIGISMAGPDITAVMQPAIPIYVSLFSMTFKLEKFSWWKILGLILAIAGCLILVQIDHMKIGDQVVFGTFMLVLQTLSYATFLVIMDWHLKKYPYPYTAFSRATFWGWICMCIINAIIFPHIEWNSIPWWVWASVLYNGIVVSYIAHGIMAWAVGRVQAVIPAISVCLQPFITTILAWVFFGDILHLRDVLAMVVIIIGLLLVVGAKFREQTYLEKNDEQQNICDGQEFYNERLLQDNEQDVSCKLTENGDWIVL